MCKCTEVQEHVTAQGTGRQACRCRSRVCEWTLWGSLASHASLLPASLPLQGAGGQNTRAHSLAGAAQDTRFVSAAGDSSGWLWNPQQGPDSTGCPLVAQRQQLPWWPSPLWGLEAFPEVPLSPFLQLSHRSLH